MAHRKRDRVSGAVPIIEADEAYRAVIETCVRLANCRAEAVSDLQLALPKLEKLRSARRTMDGPPARCDGSQQLPRDRGIHLRGRYHCRE
jgi:hypothetical protein